MTFGEKIQKLRKEAGISQEELSFQLGVSRQAISKWENDKGYPETEKMLKMSKIFQVTMDYLLNDEDNYLKEEIEKENGFYVSEELANGFLFHQTLKFRKLALALALLLAGTAFIFILDDAGVLFYLIIVIVSIALFVSLLLKGNPYLQLRNESLVFDEMFKQEFLLSYRKKQRKYQLLILLSVILFSISFLFMPVAGLEFFGEHGENTVLAASMMLSGTAVYFFTYSLGALRSYQLLVKNEIEVKGE